MWLTLIKNNPITNGESKVLHDEKVKEPIEAKKKVCGAWLELTLYFGSRTHYAWEGTCT